jgi:hypothetical protein
MKAMIYIIALLVLASGAAASKDDLTGLQITGYHFTSNVMGPYPSLNDAEGTYHTTVNPDISRGIALLIQANAEFGTSIDPHNFTMEYISNGKKVLKNFDGIGLLRDYGFGLATSRFAFAGESTTNNSVVLEGPVAHFALFGILPNDVQTIKISSNQSKDIITQKIGANRNFSVFLSTNTISDAQLKDLQENLTSKGYYVDISNTMDKDISGVTVFYWKDTDQTKDEANKVAKVLKNSLNRYIDVEPLPKSYASDTDLLVWVGTQ